MTRIYAKISENVPNNSEVLKKMTFKNQSVPGKYCHLLIGCFSHWFEFACFWKVCQFRL